MPRQAEPLSDRTISRLKASGSALRVAVGGAKGLMLSVTPSGTRTFYHTFRDSLGKVVWFRLGEWDAEGFPVEAARARSAELRAAILAGADPRVELAAARQKAADDLAAMQRVASRPRWERLVDLYAEHIKANGKPRTIAWAVDLMENHLDKGFRQRHADDAVLYPPKKIQRKRRNKAPGAAAAFLAGKLVDDITRQDMKDLHASVKEAGGGVTADRALAIVRMAFSIALDKKDEFFRADNPAADLKIPSSGVARKVFLDADQLPDLGRALDEAEAEGLVPWQAPAAVRLMLATGLRKSEVLTLRWKEVDLRRGLVTKKDHKTSKKTGDLVQPLSLDALEVLRAVAERRDTKLSPYVLPGVKDAQKPFSNLNKAWAVILERAGLSDIHLHDLRRTASSWGKVAGVDLQTTSRLMNHSDIRVTAKVYAQVDMEQRREGINKISGAIGTALRTHRK